MTFVRSEPFTVIEDFLQKRVDFLIIFMYDKAITVMITVLKQKITARYFKIILPMQLRYATVKTGTQRYLLHSYYILNILKERLL